VVVEILIPRNHLGIASRERVSRNYFVYLENVSREIVLFISRTHLEKLLCLSRERISRNCFVYLENVSREIIWFVSRNNFVYLEKLFSCFSRNHFVLLENSFRFSREARSRNSVTYLEKFCYISREARSRNSVTYLEKHAREILLHISRVVLV